MKLSSQQESQNNTQSRLDRYSENNEIDTTYFEDIKDAYEVIENMNHSGMSILMVRSALGLLEAEDPLLNSKDATKFIEERKERETKAAEKSGDGLFLNYAHMCWDNALEAYNILINNIPDDNMKESFDVLFKLIDHDI